MSKKEVKLFLQSHLSFIVLFCVILFHILSNIVVLHLDHTPPLIDAPGHAIEIYRYVNSFRQSGFVGVFKTLHGEVVYPPLYYMTSAIIAYFTYNLDLVLYTNFLFICILVIFSYLFVRQVTNKKIALFVSSMIMFIPIIYGQSRVFYLDFSSLAFLPVILYFYERSEHFTSIRYSFLFSIFWSIGFLFKYNVSYAAFFYIIYRFLSGHNFFNKRRISVSRLRKSFSRYFLFGFLGSILPLLWLISRQSGGMLVLFEIEDWGGGFSELSSHLFWGYNVLIPALILLVFSFFCLKLYSRFSLKKKYKSFYSLPFFLIVFLFPISFFILFFVFRVRWFLGSIFFLLFFIFVFADALEHKMRRPYLSILIVLLILSNFFILSYVDTPQNEYGRILFPGLLYPRVARWHFDDIYNDVSPFVSRGALDDPIRVFVTDSFSAQDYFLSDFALRGKYFETFVYITQVNQFGYEFNASDIRQTFFSSDILYDVSVVGSMDVPDKDQYTELIHNLMSDPSSPFVRVGTYELPRGVNVTVYYNSQRFNG